MQKLGIKKFFLDYLVGSLVIVVLFLLLAGKITGIDTRATVELGHECFLPFPVEEVLQSLQAALKEGESCKIVSPCVELQVIQCAGTEPVSGVWKVAVKGDSMRRRVVDSLIESYGLSRHVDNSLFRINREILLILLAYGLILAEATALFFALWRQGVLKQTLAPPAGSSVDQVFKPVFWAVLLAITVLLTNHFVFAFFEHPEIQLRPMMRFLMDSGAGVVIAICLAPLAEELIFRGVMLRFFVERNKPLFGTILVSMLFSGFHGFHEPEPGWQLYTSLMYFMLSAILCWLYIKQQNIWSPVVFHSAYNSTLVVFYYLLS